MEEVSMNLILGMDLGVFIAWIGTLLAVILCILYGVYHQFIKKSDEGESDPTQETPEKKQKEGS